LPLPFFFIIAPTRFLKSVVSISKKRKARP
jgi:hypothetical protein